MKFFKIRSNPVNLARLALLLIIWTYSAVSLAFGPTLPGPDTDLRMSAPRAVATGTTINLNWNSVSAARNYLLQYRDGSGAWQSSSGSYYGTSTSWTNVPNIVNRTYRMSACINACGEWSSASNSITTSPTAPSITVPTTDTDGSYSLSWSSISSASRYEVQGESKGTIYSGTSRSLTRTNPSGSYSPRFKPR